MAILVGNTVRYNRATYIYCDPIMPATISTDKTSESADKSSPKVGFISLGCPKALVDSERILTELRKDGYEIVPTYQDADVVVVNTCGFIDSAKKESLDTIGEALNENGKVIVTGCMGANAEDITKVHPNVLAVSCHPTKTTTHLLI